MQQSGNQHVTPEPWRRRNGELSDMTVTFSLFDWFVICITALEKNAARFESIAVETMMK